MKKIIFNIAYIFILLLGSIDAYTQGTMKDYIGLPIDSTGVNLQMDSTTIKPMKVAKQEVTRSVGANSYNHIPSSYTIDKSCDIGEIPCKSSVSPSGAMTLTVPIDIYQNPEGFSPQLSLYYSSMAGDGPLGWGWGLSGVSAISRGNKSIYYDGKTEGVKVGTSDAAFFIDGQRLVKISSTSTQITFQTEQGYTKAYATVTGNEITNFEVKFPDGRKAIYGRNNGVDYYVTQITDRVGNVVKYSYESYKNHFRLIKISYGRSDQASISFKYSQRPSDAQYVFNAGKMFTYDYVLSSIISSVNSNTLRTYSLSYVNKGLVAVISKIDCGTSTKRLNPLIFYYGDNNQLKQYKKEDTQLTHWYNFETANQVRTVKGKFDYGTTDDGIIMLPSKSPYVEYYRKAGTFNHSRNYFTNQYAGDETIIIATGLKDEFGMPNPELKTEAGFIDIFCMDIDEFEGEEIVKVNNYVSGNYDRIDFHVYTSNLYYGIVKKYTRSFNFNTLLDHRGTKSVNPKYCYTGDFNGDGKMEVLVVSAYNAMNKGASSKCYLIDLEGNKIIYEGSPFAFWLLFPAQGNKSVNGDEAYAQSNKLYSMDYDGDGKTDLCLINDNGATIYTFDAAGSSISCRSVATSSNIKNTMLRDRDFLLGEFNGDGKSDFILSPAANSSSTWSIFSSTGHGLFEQKDILITSKISSSKFMLQDMNFDGQTDIVETYGTGSSVTLATYYISNQSYKSSTTTTIPKETVLIPTNLQSRNFYCNLIGLRTGGIVSKMSISYDDSKNRLLTGVINSYGVINKVGYQALNMEDGFNIYSPGYGAKFPYQNYDGGLTVCSNLSTYYNNNLISDIYYQYTNAVIHKQGLGFRGFENFYSSDNMTGKYTSQTFDPLRFSVLTKDDSNYQSNEYTYSVNMSTNKLAKVSLTKKVTTDKTKNISFTGTYVYDAYNNITQEVVDYGGGLTNKVENSYRNIDNTTIYLLGLPITEQTTSYRGSETDVKRTVMTYNSLYLPAKKECYAGNNNKIKNEEFIYNNLNQLIKTTTNYYSSGNNHTIGYSYDNNGLLLTKTNTLGLTDKYSYNNKGELTKLEDYKGNVTTYEYDVWGRQIKIISPDNLTLVNTASWATSPENALIVITKSLAGGKDIQTYLDAFNREIRSGEKCFDGKYLFTDNVYDSRGRLSKVSYPFKSTASKWKVYNYDYQDRIIEIAYASGKKDTYSYNGLATTTVSNGISTKRTYNSIGELITVEDVSGTITYNYRPDGQLASVDALGGAVISYEYDVYGRKIKETTPSAGTKVFTYDTAGNMNSETDANGKVTRITYDAYNRMIKYENVGDLITDYTYNSDGLLLSEISNNGTAKNYTYDELFRLTSEKETGVDSKWLQKNYTYNLGNISSTEYICQSGFIGAENYLYSNGNLSEIKLNNTTSIWKLTEENELGLPLKYATGVLNRSYSYDADGRTTSIVASVNSINVQNNSYDFLATTGNLNSRVDKKRNIQENFGYDNLNRLTSFAGQTMTYDNRGNITNSSSVGQFEYNSTNPYAIESVIPNGNRIPLRSQNIIYNKMQRPVSITENGYTANFVYNGDIERVKMSLNQGTTNKLTRYYIGGKYELDQTPTSTREKLYLGGDAYSSNAVLVKNNTGDWNIYYICRDYLGSITQITDATGNIVQELSYDAWGNLRNPETQALYDIGQEPELFLGRGYTGHEHLAVFGLINMNGRLYDPVLGRFLSPDPFIQVGDFGQNFNSYSYCLNNPLIYIDQNGQWFLIDDLVAAIIGGVVNVVVNVVQGNVHSVGQGFALFGAGVVSGVVTIYVGPIAGAAVLGVSNSILNQGFNNGWGNISWEQVGTSGIMGAATSYLGGPLGNMLSKPIESVTSSIASPVLREALTQGAVNSATGFALGTGMALGTGSDLGDALKQGGQGAAFGLATGVISGTVEGYQTARQDKISPWTGDKTQGHHSDPKFMGGEPKQDLTPMTEQRHHDLHKDLNEFLRKQTNEKGQHMRPQKGNSGHKIQAIFDKSLRFDAMKRFYDQHPVKYWDARLDFYRNRNILRQWRPLGK